MELLATALLENLYSDWIWIYFQLSTIHKRKQSEREKWVQSTVKNWKTQKYWIWWGWGIKNVNQSQAKHYDKSKVIIVYVVRPYKQSL
jgi:hypothetical protein